MLKSQLHSATPTLPSSALGYVMVPLPQIYADRIRLWQQERIPPTLLSAKGLETELHITVFFGLYPQEDELAKYVSVLQEIAQKTPLFTLSAGPIGVFSASATSKPFDVVYQSILSSPDLIRLRRNISKLHHIPSVHAYKPHITLAYLTPNTAQTQPYENEPGPLADEQIKIGHLVYKSPGRKPYAFPLAGMHTPITRAEPEIVTDHRSNGATDTQLHHSATKNNSNKQTNRAEEFDQAIDREGDQGHWAMIHGNHIFIKAKKGAQPHHLDPQQHSQPLAEGERLPFNPNVQHVMVGKNLHQLPNQIQIQPQDNLRYLKNEEISDAARWSKKNGGTITKYVEPTHQISNNPKTNAAGVDANFALSYEEKQEKASQYEKIISPEDQHIIDAATLAFKTNKDSRAHNSTYDPVNRTSIYSPQRLKVHANIAFSDDYFGTQKGLPKNGQPPSLVVLAGPSGAGKSTILPGEINPDDYVILDCDALKEKLPEYNGKNAAYLHKESIFLLDQFASHALKEKRNIVIDGTLADAGKWSDFIENAREKGYNTRGIHVGVNLDTAFQRVAKRYQTSGRYVPFSIVAGNWDAMQSGFTYIAQQGLFDSWVKYDNNGSEPKKIAESKSK